MDFNPFENNPDLLEELKLDLKSVLNDDHSTISESQIEQTMLETIKWISTAPKSVVLRINTLLTDEESVLPELKKSLTTAKFSLQNQPEILTFAEIPEMIYIKSWCEDLPLDLNRYEKEIIVDLACGAAVLRGANVYAVGVIGYPHDTKPDSTVSIYAAPTNCCKKGCTQVKSIKNKIYVGNGIVRLSRSDIFVNPIKNPGIDTLTGKVAVEVISTPSRVPQISDKTLPKGHCLLQNLPSIICSRILDPQKKETVLDMCAAPGHKTSHLAQLMQNTGTLIALDKNNSKVIKSLEPHLKDFHVTNVRTNRVDSRAIISEDESLPVSSGPPFSRESFDRILLDGPCSGLGQRPRFRVEMSARELRSFPKLQSHLFDTAVGLLKPGGILVYSTCTITIAENETVVARALKKYPELHLVPIRKQCDDLNLPFNISPGYLVEGLTLEQSSSLCRFDYHSDSIGFFIACFKKDVKINKTETVY